MEETHVGIDSNMAVSNLNSHTHTHKNRSIYCACLCARSDLGVCESSDGHPRYPAVFQVSVSWWNNDLIQEVHAREVMIGDLDDARSQGQG